MSETPATTPDPETGAEGDTDQLSAEDVLFDRGDYDPLDEGYSPPERERPNRWGETQWEQSHDEPLDDRLQAEEPDWWEDTQRPRDDTRAGRLVADDDADPDEEGGARSNDLYGQDAGVDGAAATAEEAAMHWTEQP